MNWKINNKLVFSNKKIWIVFGALLLMSLSGCGNESVDNLDEIVTVQEKSETKGDEKIQVNIETAVPFDPYYKIFYLEPNDWGNSGLEQDETIAGEYLLNQIVLQKGEHIVYLEIYDYDVCDYIEEVMYSLDDEGAVMGHCIVLDRQRNCIGTLSYEFDNSSTDKYRAQRILEMTVVENTEMKINSYYSDPIIYSPRYYLYDFNEDGHIDVYDSTQIYLWTEEGYILCSDEEKKELVDEKFRNHNEIEEMERIQEFKDKYVEIMEEESGEAPEWLAEGLCVDWQVVYLQLKDLPNAEKINQQIRNAVDGLIAYYLDLDGSTNYESNDLPEEDNIENVSFEIYICANDIVYCGKEYLVVKIERYFTDRQETANVLAENYGFQYMTFYLKTGDIVTVSDVIGADYIPEQIEELAWKGYKKRMEEIPDQYSEERFDDYYNLVFNNRHTWSTGWGAEKEWKLEEYFHYYFTDEGMVINYSEESQGYIMGTIPIIYRLDERLEPIKNEEVLQVLTPWEDIK
ncbi:MAG: hypothetical protein ACI4DK_04325 [Lachnospiraceae bacterium]